MDDKFELPPRRELPEDIKDRMRATVRMRMDDPEFEPQGRGRRFLAAAAAILVVATGAAVVVQSTQDEHAATDPSATTTMRSTDGFAYGNQRTADRALVERCFRAARNSPQAARYPARIEEWQGGNQMNWGQEVQQLSLKLNDQVAACELSGTTVWLSEPQTPLGPQDPTPFRLLMLTPNGGSAVNVRHGAGKVVVGVDQSGRGGLKSALEPYDSLFGVRLGEPRQLPQGAKVHVGVKPKDGNKDWENVFYPDPPKPLVTVVDQQREPAERSSPAGKKLQECVTAEREKRFRPLVGAEYLKAGAMVQYAKNRWAVVAREGARIAWCTWNIEQQRTELEGDEDFPEASSAHPLRHLGYLNVDRVPDGPDRRITTSAGILGTVTDQVSKLSVTLPEGTQLRVEVKDGTFIATVPGEPRPVERIDLVWATYVAKDATGKVIGQGPFYPR